MQTKKLIKCVIIFIIIILSGGLYSCQSSKEKVVLNKTSVTESNNEIENVTSTEELSEEVSTASDDLIWVHICGEVENPGVYSLKEGSRLYELIELAGGMTQQAAKNYLNLVEKLIDGQRVQVPSVDELESGTYQTYLSLETQIEKSNSNSLININTASKEQLMTLPGIGESKANSIITYRQENGKFAKIEDIMNISGIKNAAFEKIKDLITV